MTALQDHFVERISQYPVVVDACGKASDYYVWAKNRSSLLNRSLNWTELVLHTAVSTARPVISRLEHPISRVDQFSCRQLDKIERRYPIINEPTDQIFDKTKEVYETVVKERVCGVIQPVVRPFVHTITGVKYGISTVSRSSAAIALSLSETRGGKVLVSRLNDALDLADRSVDYYLPEVPTYSQTNEGLVPTEVSPTAQNQELTDEKQSSSNIEAPITRVTSLTSKVRRRMYTRAMNDLTNIRLRCQDSISKMTSSINLISQARNRFHNAKVYTFEMEAEWRNALLEVEENLRIQRSRSNDGEDSFDEVRGGVRNDETLSQTDRIMEFAQFWAYRLQLGTTAASLVMYRHLPEHLQQKVDYAKTCSSELYNTLKESPRVIDIKDSFVEAARNAVTIISENLDHAFNYLKESSVFAWLHHKEPSEIIKMEPLNVPESKADVTYAECTITTAQQPLIPFIQFSPSKSLDNLENRRSCGSCAESDHSSGSMPADDMPLVSEDELE